MTAVQFVKRLPTMAPGRVMDVGVWDLKMTDALWWDQEIQPAIDAGSPRADQGWHWPVFLRVHAAWARIRGRGPQPTMLGNKRSTGHILPLSLILPLGDYPLMFGSLRIPVFVWYFATAPTSHLVRKGYLNPNEVPGLVGQAGLDMAVCFSHSLGQNGTLWLHATPTGGQALFEWYRRDCGMDVLLPRVRLPRLRRNDGRYFFFAQATAKAFTMKLDPFRK